jgi:methyl-accepting chemotaxis protein
MLRVRSIASAMNEQAESSKAVTGHVNNVNCIAAKNSELLAEVDEQLKNLLQKSNELKALVEELRG